MKKPLKVRTKQCAWAGLLLMVALFFSGCPYESIFPLGRSDTATIDDQLLGRWESCSGEDEKSHCMVISQFNDHEYLITAEKEGEKESPMMRAFSTIVGEYRFLNVQEIETGSRKGEKWSRPGAGREKSGIL
ncbi:MAG: hypothetical protein JRI80_18110 [Deltaproteobacteria bacterium]|nr:hypothetical protein [Deltaproteobacteria bacterium]